MVAMPLPLGSCRLLGRIVVTKMRNSRSRWDLTRQNILGEVQPTIIGIKW